MSDLSPAVESTAEAAQRLTPRLADAVGRRGWTVGTAESLTGGTIATVLAAAPQAQEWFRGSVVAYSAQVKFDLLGVEPGPVVTQDCALTMARSTARLLGADLAVAVTGVGGPDREEGKAPGTVWFALVGPDQEVTEEVVFDGGPPEVLARTTEHALGLLLRAAADR